MSEEDEEHATQVADERAQRAQALRDETRRLREEPNNELSGRADDH